MSTSVVILETEYLVRVVATGNGISATATTFTIETWDAEKGAYMFAGSAHHPTPAINVANEIVKLNASGEFPTALVEMMKS